MFSKPSKILILNGLIIFMIINSFFRYPLFLFVQILLGILILLIFNSIYFSTNNDEFKIEDNQSPFSKSFSTLIKQIPFPLLIVNKEGEFLYASPAFKNILNNKATNIAQTNVEMRSILTHALDVSLNRHYEFNYNLRVYDLHFVLLKKNQYLFIFTDITRQITDQRNTRRFLADASHELRTPITAIKGISESLISNQEKDVDVIHNFLSQIHFQRERLETMVSDMLLTSKLSQHHISIDKTKFDLLELVTQAQKSFQKEYDKKGLTLQIPTTSLFIHADYKKVLTIMNNLIHNALRYSEQGVVTVDYYEESNHIIITVEDQGFGISTEDLDSLFERFYRVDSARNSKIGGSGLGLSITKQLVEEHGGKILVESEINKGSKFKVILPQS
ncbi:MAG: hypothetical protein GX778_03585 [Erysipelothrix sp.]|nr:hypothetical protein [Erysipelothrix sp.]